MQIISFIKDVLNIKNTADSSVLEGEDALPEDIIRIIFSLLSPKEWLSSTLVCRKWERLSNEAGLWEKIGRESRITFPDERIPSGLKKKYFILFVMNTSPIIKTKKEFFIRIRDICFLEKENDRVQIRYKGTRNNQCLIEIIINKQDKRYFNHSNKTWDISGIEEGDFSSQDEEENSYACELQKFNATYHYIDLKIAKKINNKIATQLKQERNLSFVY